MPASLQIDNGTELTFEVLVTDMGGLLNDGDPSTVVDFADGGWTAYEDGNGVAGQIGGTDRSFVLTADPGAQAPPPPPSSGGGGGAVATAFLLILGFFALHVARPNTKNYLSRNMMAG